MKKRVLLVHTGGTLGMVEGQPDKQLQPAQLHESVLKFVPELSELADLDTKFVCNIDSANLTIKDINNVMKSIQDAYNDYDGFVVIHGTDTMAYHASALSFMIENNRKPIVFTGSQKPLRQIRTDARTNLVNSVEFATMPIPEVCISFDSKLFRANRTRKVSIGQFNAFQSPNYPLLGTVGVEIKLNEAFLASKPQASEHFLSLSPSHIVALKIFPGFKIEPLIASLAQSRIDGLIIEAYAAGNVPIFENSLIPSIEQLTRAEIPVFIVSQALEGSVDLSLYECGRKAMDAGAIGCGPMTFEASLFKLFYLLTKYPQATPEKLAIKMKLDVAGELS